MDVPAKFGDFRLKTGRINLLFGRQDPFYALFVQYLIAFCSRKETASDVTSCRFVGPIVPNKQVKFRDPWLNRSQEIPPEVVGGGTFNGFSQ